MTEHRIVTNGINFRIQWFGKTWFLRRPKWYFFKQFHPEFTMIAEFSTREEAGQALKMIYECDKAVQHGWGEV